VACSLHPGSRAASGWSVEGLPAVGGLQTATSARGSLKGAQVDEDEGGARRERASEEEPFPARVPPGPARPPARTEARLTRRALLPSRALRTEGTRGSERRIEMPAKRENPPPMRPTTRDKSRQCCAS
ncbi:unnamed protein product, partial [Prorocentrum cordatum]